MRNKVLLTFLVLILAILPIFACKPAAPVVGERIKFTVSHIYMPESWNAKYNVPSIFPLVEKETKGKYTFDVAYYAAGTLLTSPDIFPGTVKGITDIGWANPGITPGLFPVMLTLTQVGIAPPLNAYANSLTWWEFYKKFKPKEFDDVKVLFMLGVGPGWIHSKKPIRKVEDIKGLKIRVLGAPHVPVMKALGAEAIALPSAEIYLSAKKGVIDAALIPLGAVAAFKLEEVFDYSTCVPPLYNEGKYMVMNWAKWKALPEDLKAAFEAVADEAVDLNGRIWHCFDPTDTLETYLKQKKPGYEVIYLSEAELAKMRALIKPMGDAYIAELTAKGFPGEKLAAEAGKMMEKNNKKKFEPWKPPAK